MAETSIEDFAYPDSGLPVVSNWTSVALIDSEGAARARTPKPTAEVSAKECEAAFERGRSVGIEEGQRIERLAQAAALQQLNKDAIEKAARLNEQFLEARESYLHAVEPEVVQLAVRVAERILRREVEVDPLMLTGAVRVALGQLADKTSVRIRVPVEHASLWSETIARLPNLRAKPMIVADEQLGDGECRLESDAGSADLGVESQLREIGGILSSGRDNRRRKIP